MPPKKRPEREKTKPKAVREPTLSFSTSASPGLKMASLFMNGRSQAVRLPKEFRFEGTHVYVRKDGNRVILTPTDDRIERLISVMGSIPDFPDRDQGEPQLRPELDDLFES